MWPSPCACRCSSAILPKWHGTIAAAFPPAVKSSGRCGWAPELGAEDLDLAAFFELEECSMWQSLKIRPPCSPRRCRHHCVRGLTSSAVPEPWSKSVRQSPAQPPLRWSRLSDVHVLVGLDSSCCTTEVHKKPLWPNPGLAQQGSSGCGERTGAVTRQENVTIIRFESLQLLGSSIFYWKKVLPQIHQVLQTPSVILLALWCPIGILIWCSNWELD